MAKKDAYYFSHDANAQDDPKCMLLIDQMGMEGYGIFWALVERLRNEKDYKLPTSIISALSKRWNTSKEKVETVIKNYGLFSIEGDSFFSNRLKNSMELKSLKAKESISYRWGDTDVKRPKNKRNTDVIRIDTNKVKESKGKEIKEKDDGVFVFFGDGSSQVLGEVQTLEYKQGRLIPKQIIKGQIN